MNFAKAKAAHALIKELDGPNAAARVAAARSILEDTTITNQPGNMPQQPGFTIQIVDARSSAHALPAGQVVDVTPTMNGSVALPRLD